jgi:hypothetical protein
LKTKDLAISNFNIEIENIGFTINSKSEALIPPKIGLNSARFPENENDYKKDEASPDNNKDYVNLNIKEYFEKEDKELIELTTLPENINYVNVPLDSFEVEVDIVNHITESGGLENLKLEINEKKSNIKSDNAFNQNKKEVENIFKMEELQNELKKNL